jgi:hypothetical protein
MKTAFHVFFVLFICFGCAVTKQVPDSIAPAAKAAAVRVSSQSRKREPLEELVRARAKLTEKEVVAIAASVAKLDSSRFDVLVRAHLESKRVLWWVQFHPASATLVLPGTDISITIDDETRTATFDPQMWNRRASAQTNADGCHRDRVSTNMKTLSAIVLSFAVVTLTGCNAREVTKPAKLILPPQVTLRGNGADIRPVVYLQWDEADTVSIDVEMSMIQPDGHSRAGVVGVLSVYDVDGKNMEFQGLMMGPTIVPNGRRDVKKGDSLNMPLYSTVGHFFRSPGRYYAIAEFSGITSRGAKVRFKTERQWFELTEK